MDDPELLQHARLDSRMWSLLGDGPRTIKEMADTLGVTVRRVESVLKKSTKFASSGMKDAEKGGRPSVLWARAQRVEDGQVVVPALGGVKDSDSDALDHPY